MSQVGKSEQEQFNQNNTVDSSEETIRRLSQEWIEQGYSPQENTKNFTYEEYLARFYNSTPNAVALHDSNDPKKRIETNAQAYGRLVEELYANIDYVDNKLTRFYQIEVESNLAFASFTADAIVISDGNKSIIPVFYTLVWQQTENGWRIIHEHGSDLIAKDSSVGTK